MTAGSSSKGSHAIASAARSAVRRPSGRQQSGIIQNFQSGLSTPTRTSSSASASHTACGVCSSSHSFSTSSAIATSSSHLDTTSPSYSAASTSASSLPPKASTTPQRRSALIRPVRIVPPRQPTSLSKAAKRAPKTHQPPVRPSLDERTAQVSKLYALQAVPPPTALAALANRISSTLLGNLSGSNTKDTDEWLKKIEMCCTCPSFWSVVKEEERQEEIRRFQEQQQRLASSNEQETILSLPEKEKRYTNYLDGEKLHNEALATLGNHLLGVFAIEWLEARYPRLPTGALKAALTLYVGPRTCADIASRQWGIHSGQAASQAFLGITASHVTGQPLRGVNEGGRAGMGLLRWGKPSDDDLRNLVQRGGSSSASVKTREENDHRTPLPLEEALASAARAVVGLVFQEHGFVAARQFVHANFLSRQADIGSLLKFSNPKYTLSSTLSRQAMIPPTTRILAETGRLSIAPIFVMGVYSGSLKLGEGYGSSLAMAEYRACEDALRRIYLSSEEKFINIFAAEGAKQKNALISNGHAGSEEAITGYPSDTLGNASSKVEQRPLMEDETFYQSSGRSSIVSRA